MLLATSKIFIILNIKIKIRMKIVINYHLLSFRNFDVNTAVAN